MGLQWDRFGQGAALSPWIWGSLSESSTSSESPYVPLFDRKVWLRDNAERGVARLPVSKDSKQEGS